jgi:hypothetical protein
MSLFNTPTPQHVSAYLANIKCRKIIGEIGALLYTVIPRVDIFS